MSIVYSEIKHSKRKKFFSRVLKVFLALIFLVGFSAYALFFTDFLKFKDIKIEGLSLTEKEIVYGEAENVLKKKFLWVFPRDRIFLAPYSEIKNRILGNLSQISRVEFPWSFSKTLIIKVEERNPAGVLCADKNCFFVDETGYIFERAPFFSGGVFHKFFDERKNRPGLKEFLLPPYEAIKIFNFIKSVELKFPVTEIFLKDEGIYEFYTQDGWYLILEKNDNPVEAYDNLLILADEIKDEISRLEYIDLRFGAKVFYKLK